MGGSEIGSSASGLSGASGPSCRLGEARLPPTVAVVVAVVLYASLPNQLLVGPRFVIPILEGILLVALVATDPRRITRQTRQSRMISLVLIAVIVVTNLVPGTAGRRPGQRPGHRGQQPAAGGVAGVGDERDRVRVDLLGARPRRAGRPDPAIHGRSCRWPISGSPRTRPRTPWSRSAAGSSKKADWIPTFVDYLYLSTTNSSAFSPTDTMPLTSRVEDADGRAGHRRVDHLAAGHRPRRQRPTVTARSGRP